MISKTLGEVRKGIYKNFVNAESINDNIFLMQMELGTLEGFPTEVKGNIIVSVNNLTSLEGSLKKVQGEFNASRNELVSLKGIPEITGRINLSNCGLTSLKYIQEKVGGNLELRGNNLTSLEPLKEVMGELNIKGNKFVSKESLIQEIIDSKINITGTIRSDFGNFIFDENEIKSYNARKKMGKFKDLLDI